MKRFLSYLVIVLVFPFSAQAAIPETTKDSLLFGVNEGTAGQKDFGEMQGRYKALADYLAKSINKPVKLESSQNLKSSSSNLAKGRYALFFSKPANVAAKAIRDQNYQLVAMAKGEFTVKFIVNANSPLKKPEDIKGKRIALAKGTFMERAGMAELRDRNLVPAADKIQAAKFQDAIEFIVEKGFADVGMVSPIVAKSWVAKGGSVLFESRKMPFWSLIASPDMSKDDVIKIQSTLVNMENSDEGRKLLEKLGVKGFVPGSQKEYLDLQIWLEKT
ncbi:MAG: PhnD/SsuA/transferrin family substrate-binding protein [Sulfurimicrobium sp.]|nr:PhnD/SsuA/transferrin family substrate-binding protein [Sulfurimicrobium sp.]MDP1705768.1 PhnD/SsuA/transferrin family substrate-binding protein [Sulfurimicrobium sp.]MDP1896665.1 PhnD/SsuA/transferrin family substrate-binding protein [Sulfurimicrobium sp.]MDP2198159.1 PhnD/SsuA/transferrin family substrate-binding protein [Sulfurimicrobium sp.]MDP2962667.1 PhnD/SsuA/transferrin family substrate-binding protein [Sulfurimicrobium sp.]